MNNLRILYKLTTRSRPQRAIQCLDAIYALKSNNPNFITVVTLDEDDTTCNNTEFLAKLMTYDKLVFYLGLNKNKVDAINQNLNYVSWDILINVSDDQIFTKQNFDNLIRLSFVDMVEDGSADMMGFMPETRPVVNLDRVLHCPDNHNPELLTMSIIGRDYYNRDGYIYHPSYIGLYCDNEAQQVANLRGCLKKFDLVMFNHFHPNYGKVPRDDQYNKYDFWEAADKANFQLRHKNNFYL